MELKAIPKRRESSLAVIIPKEVADKERIMEKEAIVVEIKRLLVAREVFGMLKGWKKSPQQLKNEARAEC